MGGGTPPTSVVPHLADHATDQNRQQKNRKFRHVKLYASIEKIVYVPLKPTPRRDAHTAVTQRWFESDPTPRLSPRSAVRVTLEARFVAPIRRGDATG